MEFQAKKLKGEFSITNERFLKKWMTSFREGQEFKIEISPKSKNITQPALDYYFGVMLPCLIEGCKERGDYINKKEANKILERQFLVDIQNGPANTIIEVIKKVESLTHEELNQFLISARMFILEEFGIDVPELNEHYK